MQDVSFGPVFVCPIFQVLMVVVLVIAVVTVVVLSLWSAVDELAATHHIVMCCWRDRRVSEIYYLVL